MEIREFKGRKYDFEKVMNYNIKVDDKIERVEEDNNKRFARLVKSIENGSGASLEFFHENGFCTFCGAVRPSGEIGVGCGCKKIVEKFLNGYLYNKDFVEIPQELTDKYFLAYKKYVRFVRALYLYNNTKNNDMKTLKSFRNSFKKSFTQSMLNNTECKISKKQLEIMEKDSCGYTFECGSINHSIYKTVNSYEEVLEIYKKYVFNKFYYNNGFNEFRDKIFNSPEFGFYCRIQVANAWVD